MRTAAIPCIYTSLLVLACGDAGGGRDDGNSAGSVTAVSGITVTSPLTTSEPTSGATGSGGATSTSDGTGGAASSGPGELKFDVGKDTGGIDPDPDTEGAAGCQKIDFLFVVDNSGSMADEQESLANSFDGFISSIQDTVMAKDYHIMVIDTDAGNSFEQSCFVICQLLPVCEGYACNNLPKAEGCDAMLGTGLIDDPSGKACGVAGGKRFMVDGQPNLSSTFGCLAKVGTDGDGSERPMEAMIAAITSLNGAGGCNEGFLRKDALLVVTFITDEEDDGKSKGTPAGWNAALVAAKVGAEKSIVVLGLIGDPDQPNPVCAVDAAEASPRLRTFAESFTFGSWGSICSPDYAPFFDASVSVIDTACQQFEPPG
jgi:hypothetical protein